MPPARIRPPLLGLLLALALTPSRASAQAGGLSDEAELARAITLYDAGRYADCVKEFADLVGRRPGMLLIGDALGPPWAEAARAVPAQGRVVVAIYGVYA